MKLTAYEKEYNALIRQERAWIKKNAAQSGSALNKLLAEKVPEKLQGTLDTAFSKAFALIFNKGSALIEKTFDKDEREKRFKIARFSAELMQDRRSFRTISKRAAASGNVNLAVSAAAGIGMGAVGVGLPDIPVFAALLLKNIYEISLSYGYDYDSDGERAFILRLIEAAVSHGSEFERLNEELDGFVERGSFSEECPRPELISRAAAGLSKELLYMKFLQGVPIVGVVGGAYDVVYMQRIGSYARLKYKKRFLRDFNKKTGN